MKIYLAGPDVFRENAKDHGNFLKALCLEFGHEGLYPLDNEVDFNKPNVSKVIFEENFKLIKGCDVILANIESFRGPSMDVGTAWEIGAGKALGKQVILYNSNDSLYINKAVGDNKFPIVEDFGLEDNLMIIHGADHIANTIEEALKLIEV